MKHYARIQDGVVEWVGTRLPRTIFSADGQTKCHTPEQVEANGELHLYAIHVFDSKPATALTSEDRQDPLTVDDVAWDGSTASATHRKMPRDRKERRRELFAHGRSLWDAADWTTGPDWVTYKTALRVQIAGVKDNTIAPKDVVWPVPPADLEIT